MPGVASTAVAIQQVGAGYVLAGIMASVGLAVGSHWLVEGNQPLILINPFFGAIANLRTFWLALTGRLERELARHLELKAEDG